MKLSSILISFLIVGWLAGTSRAEEPPAPQVEEVLKLIHNHWIGASEKTLNRAAVQGLLSELNPQVRLVSEEAPPGGTDAEMVQKTGLFDSHYGYVRIAAVRDDLDEELDRSLKSLMRTNPVKGVVLDLRFAKGIDYAAAAACADRFMTTAKPLLNWGSDSAMSTAKTNAWTLPLVVLINRQTSGAAEALAAVLRQSAHALLIGAPTAGQALITQDFALSTGQKLRIAVARVRLGNGTALETEGVKPDIDVAVEPAAERVYFQDPYHVFPPPVATGPTNSLAAAGSRARLNRPVLNEAELVRRRREGLDLDLDALAEPEPAEPPMVVRDPALARGLDLLKGLSRVVTSF